MCRYFAERRFCLPYRLSGSFFLIRLFVAGPLPAGCQQSLQSLRSAGSNRPIRLKDTFLRSPFRTVVMRIHKLLSTHRWRSTLAAAGLLLTPLAGLVNTDQAAAQDRVYRSVTQWRERIPDEADRPRYKERWTHRGFEVVNDQITVVATTSI